MRLMALAFLSLSFTLLSGCADLANRAAQPDRTYAKIDHVTVYQLFESVLLKHGYSIDIRNYSRGYISSSLKEYEGDKKGLATWKEQRKYVAWFDIDRENPTRHFLILEVIVQERAPIAFDWKEKKIDRSKDNEYQKILAELDALVIKKGGALQ